MSGNGSQNEAPVITGKNGPVSLDWINHPPIRHVKGADISRCAEWLTAVIDEWKSEPWIAAAIETKNHPDKEIALRVSNRLKKAYKRSLIIQQQDNEDDWAVYAYFCSGVPVGMMSIDIKETRKTNSICIDSLVGHPGARNVGDILIEFALNLTDLKVDRIIRLTAVKGTSDFYRSIGFEPVNGAWNSEGWTGVELRPKPPQWALLNGRWTLTGLWDVRKETPELQPLGGASYRK